MSDNKVNPVITATATTPTQAEQIWNEIKDKEIHMFSLPSQTVAKHCAPVLIDPSRCFLLFKASATLPALETAIGTDYECNIEHKYIVVSRKAKSLGSQ